MSPQDHAIQQHLNKLAACENIHAALLCFRPLHGAQEMRYMAPHAAPGIWNVVAAVSQRFKVNGASVHLNEPVTHADREFRLLSTHEGSADRAPYIVAIAAMPADIGTVQKALDVAVAKCAREANEIKWK